MKMGQCAVLSVLFILQIISVFSEEEATPTPTQDNDELQRLADKLHFSSYLKDVMKLVHGDEDLQVKKHLHNITNGNLAVHLEEADEDVRTRLDELKRRELQRIRIIAEELKRREHRDDKTIQSKLRVVTRHLDLKNLAEFGTEDLRKLLLQGNAELAYLDEKRRERFKEYEMHKELEFDELVKRLNPEERKIVENRRHGLLIQHKNQKPAHMPLSKAHLLEVWEERDKMEKENFNAKTFFHLHDLDGNGFLDEGEVNLMIKANVQRSHAANTVSLEFDEWEAEEDFQRKRENAYAVTDINKDHLIDLEEFIGNMKRNGLQDHALWVEAFNEEVFTNEEYVIYAELHRDEVNRLIDEGKISLNVSGIVVHHDDKKSERKWRKSTTI